MKKIRFILVLTTILTGNFALGQEYFISDKGPFDPSIPTPEEFLGYPVGSQHTRHDQIVAYFEKLASISDKATMTVYGKTFELRKLIILTITSPENHTNLEQIRMQHLRVCDPTQSMDDYSELPVFVNLGYNVHGNEPSSSEAAMLTAYSSLGGALQRARR